MRNTPEDKNLGLLLTVPMDSGYLRLGSDPVPEDQRLKKGKAEQYPVTGEIVGDKYTSDKPGGFYKKERGDYVEEVKEYGETDGLQHRDDRLTEACGA
jgi:hypothetical protein